MKVQILKFWKTLISLTVIIFLFSCEKSDDLNLNDVTGTYIGTLTSDLSSKSINAKSIKSATVTVSSIGNQIEVHCLAENFDTTVILDTYNHYDSVMVCVTGEEFENMYGHKLGHGNMNGNMSGHGTPWMQHLANEHQEGDEHFGNFDIPNQTFNYTFKMINIDYHFQGIKN
jgi:hypothetical protein